MMVKKLMIDMATVLVDVATYLERCAYGVHRYLAFGDIDQAEEELKNMIGEIDSLETTVDDLLAEIAKLKKEAD